MKRRDRTVWAALAPALWLGLFFLFPFLLVAKLSLSDVALAIPPYAPRLDGATTLAAFLAALDLETYRRLVTDHLYLAAYLSSLKFAGVATAILLAIGYPMALAMARCAANVRSLLVLAVILPFWTSFLIRVYALIGILKPEGVLNIVLG